MIEIKQTKKGKNYITGTCESSNDNLLAILKSDIAKPGEQSLLETELKCKTCCKRKVIGKHNIKPCFSSWSPEDNMATFNLDCEGLIETDPDYINVLPCSRVKSINI